MLSWRFCKQFICKSTGHSFSFWLCYTRPGYKVCPPCVQSILKKLIANFLNYSEWISELVNFWPITNKFPYIHSQINACDSLTFKLFNKNVTISFFSLYFFHFVCYIFILQLIFFYESRNFYHEHWKAIYFFHDEERHKK